MVDLGAPATEALTQHAANSSSVIDRRAVGMRLDRLFTAAGPASRMSIAIGDRQWVARLERLDLDEVGFRSWVGTLEGVQYSHVVLTERDGVVSGLINAISATYQIRTLRPGVYFIERVEATRLGRELEPLVGLRGAAPATSLAASVGDEDQPITIDVLVLYTPNAQAEAGGVQQMQAVVSQVISDSNTIFGRSGVGARFRLAGTTEIALTENLNMDAHLGDLTSSPLARSLRDATGADLVHLLVSSPDATTCGVAWLLGSLAETDFHAYSVADIACLSTFTPTHEMAHTMGSHHAPEDGASEALFPFSYGYKDPGGAFRTVMALRCPNVDCPRIPNFSNPSIPHNGAPTGSSFQHNALSITLAAPTVASWRSRVTLPAPLAPTGLRWQVIGHNVTVSWDPVSSVAFSPVSYTLQVGTASGQFNLFNQPIGNATSVSGVVGVGQYFWRVLASNTAGSSPPSSEAQFTVGVPTGCVAPPSAPQNLIGNVGGGIVTLIWSASAGGVTTYIVEAGSATGLANLYNAPTGSTATVLQTPAPPGTYFVRLRAQNACGTSAPSNEQVISVP